MKVLIDTNVILDVFMRRAEYAEYAEAVLCLCGGNVKGYLLASQTTDIFYLLCRAGKKTDFVKSILKTLADNLTIVDTTAADVRNALDFDMPDYEDALLAVAAKRIKADCIITRNQKDFAGSTIIAHSPQEFLKRYY